MKTKALQLSYLFLTPILTIYTYYLGIALNKVNWGTGGEIFAITQLLFTVVFLVQYIFLSKFFKKFNSKATKVVFDEKSPSKSILNEEYFDKKVFYGFEAGIIFLSAFPTLSVWYFNRSYQYLVFGLLLLLIFILFVFLFNYYGYKETQANLSDENKRKFAKKLELTLIYLGVIVSIVALALGVLPWFK